MTSAAGASESNGEGSQAPSGPRVRVFVSFDRDHDDRLCTILLEQFRLDTSGFEVVGCSDRLLETGLWNEELRRCIGEADQFIAICGEHTECSPSMFAELPIAQEERTPYTLLWGQRGLMCTKPIGAEPADSMYSWPPQILLERLAHACRAETAASHQNAGTAP